MGLLLYKVYEWNTVSLDLSFAGNYGISYALLYKVYECNTGVVAIRENRQKYFIFYFYFFNLTCCYNWQLMW